MSIVEVGAGIREYRVGEREVLDPYPLGEICDGAHGAVLIPWPNRLEDGRYSFDGHDLQLALSEPEHANAIHGLLRWRPFQALEHEPTRVLMGTRLHPTPGYPFTLDVQIAYELGPDGLSVTTTASNLGADPCPYGAGQHPYLSAGGGLVDECILELTAQRRILTDPERGLPIGSEPTTGTALDFARPRRLAGLQLDVGLTDLARDTHGLAHAHLTGPDGLTVALWADQHHQLLQLYSGDTLAPHRRRRGLAVEPMTCPPNALRSGEHLMRLQPGGSVTTRWGVGLLRSR